MQICSQNLIILFSVAPNMLIRVYIELSNPLCITDYKLYGHLVSVGMNRYSATLTNSCRRLTEGCLSQTGAPRRRSRLNTEHLISEEPASAGVRTLGVRVEATMTFALRTQSSAQFYPCARTREIEL